MTTILSALAYVLGVLAGLVMVSELESGNAANPTLATLRRWADALGFDVNVELIDRGRAR